MHSKRIQLGLFAFASLFLVGVHFASGLQPPAPPPVPTPVTTPLPTPAITYSQPPVPSPTPVPTNPPPVNPDQSIPVVIDYGQGEATRVSIISGTMEPVGVLPNQSVTVTVSFPISRAEDRVSLGLYDGGQVGVVAPPRTSIIALNAILTVATDGTVQFNFQAGRTLGLYRVQMNVGNGQYLLRFYAGWPQGLPTPMPTPNFVP